MSTLAFLGNIGWQELLIVLIIALILFGSRLPEVARSMGKSVIEFKKGLNGVQEDVDAAGQPQARSAQPLPPPAQAPTAYAAPQAYQPAPADQAARDQAR